jgi:hypothetical protein
MSPTRKIPWNDTPWRCARCRGYHAPWWRTTRAPSCEPRTYGPTDKDRKAPTDD